jgi:hypothetical protein
VHIEHRNHGRDLTELVSHPAADAHPHDLSSGAELGERQGTDAPAHNTADGDASLPGLSPSSGATNPSSHAPDVHAMRLPKLSVAVCLVTSAIRQELVIYASLAELPAAPL